MQDMELEEKGRELEEKGRELEDTRRELEERTRELREKTRELEEKTRLIHVSPELHSESDKYVFDLFIMRPGLQHNQRAFYLLYTGFGGRLKRERH